MTSPTDFIWVVFNNPYAFNVADIAIFAGAIGLVLFTSDAEKSPDHKA